MELNVSGWASAHVETAERSQTGGGRFGGSDPQYFVKCYRGDLIARFKIRKDGVGHHCWLVKGVSPIHEDERGYSTLSEATTQCIGAAAAHWKQNAQCALCDEKYAQGDPDSPVEITLLDDTTVARVCAPCVRTTLAGAVGAALAKK
jgi:hypothetical protein